MMFRVLLWAILFLSLQTHAYIYNDSLLLIYAKIVPKIMALDRTVRQNGSKGRRLCILYEKGDRRVAKRLAKLIEKNLAEDHKNSIDIVTLPYRKTDRCMSDVSTFFLLKTNDEKVKHAIDYATKHRLLTIAYDRSMLKYGAAVSIYTGKRVYPFINIKAVKRSGLQLDPFLMQIAKIYDENAL